MEPITIASAIASIVGLLGNFRREHAGAKDLDHRKFMEWLAYHKHEELRNQIAQNHHLAVELDSMLREDHKLILAKLDQIDRMIAGIASRIEGVGPIVHLLRPEAELSDQAATILRQFVRAGTDRMQWVRTDSGVVLELPSRRDISLTVAEPQFLEDDLRRLTELGLIDLKHRESSGEIFAITRNGARLVALMQDQ